MDFATIVPATMYSANMDFRDHRIHNNGRRNNVLFNNRHAIMDSATTVSTTMDLTTMDTAQWTTQQWISQQWTPKQWTRKMDSTKLDPQNGHRNT